MKEVSCKMVAGVLREAQRRRIPVERLAEGVPYDRAHLMNGKERIHWHEFARIMENARQFWSEDDLIEIGARMVLSPWMLPINLVARLLLTPKAFYFWVNRPDQGAGNLMFTCIRPSCRETGPNELAIELKLAEGYPPCREFFVLTIGGFIAIPQVVGLKRAQVTMEALSDGARYHIKYPRGGGAIPQIVKWLARPFRANAAARQLMDMNATLESRYQELDDARQRLAAQAIQLETANAIGKRVHEAIEFEKVTAAIVESLVAVGGFARAELRATPTVDGATVERMSAQGQACEGDAPIEIALERGGAKLGRLAVWPRSGDDRKERSALLDSVAATITMALDNAFAYDALADYQVNLERKVEERTRELRQAIEERDRIFANINHEIRTPLTLVLMAAQGIAQREKQGLHDDSRREIEGIGESARKVLRLVDEMLLLAAGQTRKLALNRATCDLSALLSQTLVMWDSAATSRGIKLSSSLPPHLYLSLDEIYFERVIGNLLSNAVKFTPPGGSIHVELAEKDGEARMEVRDTGIGIDEGLRKRLFGRFEQGRPPVNGQGGSGIGLSLVRELVEAHDGQAGVESPREGGSIFWVTLPGARRTAYGSNGVVSPLQLSPVDFGLQPQRVQPHAVYEAKVPARALILLAEDDPNLAAAMANVLADEYKVLVARNGIDALKLAEVERPDMLVSDVAMPGMDGLELSRRFQQIAGNRLSPVLLVSARASLADRLAGFDAGAIDYILKPFDPRELRARVHSQLTVRGLALKLTESEKLAALGTMAAGLAHEMRNPANAIVNALGPLREQLPPAVNEPTTGTGQLLSVLTDASKQIAMLSRQLLGFKRPGALEAEAINLPDLYQRASGIMLPLLRGVTVREKLDYRGPVWCAPPMMTQVFTNLLENGVHAAGAKGWIEVSSRQEGDVCVIEVTDSGPGVPAALRERIFEPFFTTKPVGQGTGLGLTTSREIARRHGGDLTVRPAPHGTLFRLEIPISRRAS
jgi:signal transduction histidine kinase